LSKQANPALIGAFVVGAVSLLVIATVLFGGSSLFVEKIRFVTYFEGSVQGLRVGSNVTFRGVRVGYVTDVRLQAQVGSLQDPHGSLRTLVPVTIEILPGTFQFVEGDRVLKQDDLLDRVKLQQLIDAGLRAQLNTESYVTGQLLIEMDLLPDMPAVMRGVNPPYPEIPTIPNDIEQVLGNVEQLFSVFKEKVDVDRILTNVQDILQGLNEVINSKDLRDGLAGLSTLLNSPDTQQLSASLRLTMTEMHDTLEAVRAVIEKTGSRAEPAIENFDRTLGILQKSLTSVTERLDGTLQQVDKTLVAVGRGAAAIDEKLNDDSPFTYRLNETLVELKAAARALRIFLDYLEQHPESLLRGKPE